MPLPMIALRFHFLLASDLLTVHSGLQTTSLGSCLSLLPRNRNLSQVTNFFSVLLL
jgi:hypothetical protein